MGAADGAVANDSKAVKFRLRQYRNVRKCNEIICCKCIGKKSLVDDTNEGKSFE